MREPEKSVAILCTGPSLATFLASPEAHDVYIGVNRAVEGYRCDWWVFNDSATLGYFEPIGRPRVFTSAACAGRITMRAKFDEFEHTFFHEIGTSCRTDPGWDKFSMTCAMVLAEHLGASLITIYGCDWEGSDDWCGPLLGAKSARSQYRWKNEQHKYGHVEGWLRSLGVDVVRKVPVVA